MQNIRLGLEWFLNPDHIPFMVGMKKGWFEQAGIKLEMIEPAEHMDAVEEIQQGTMDIAVTEPIHLVADRAAGKKVKGFARFLNTNGGVMFLKDSGITRPRDLVGKRIQYPGAPGPGGIAIARTMAINDGAECMPSDFTPVNNGFYHTNALAEGKADAATLIFYNFEVIEARGRGLDADFFSLWEWGIPDFCQLILISTEDKIQTMKKEFGAIVKVIRRGIAYLHENPEDAVKIYDEFTSGAYTGDELGKKICDATIPCFTYDFGLSRAYFKQLRNWMFSTQQIKWKIKPKDCWTNRFVW